MTVTFLGMSARSASYTGGVRTFVESYHLETSLQSEGSYAVGSHSSLPIYGQQHGDDPTAYCNDIQIDNHEYWKGWTATYTYSTERVFATDPTADPAIITVHTEQFQKVAETDINGNAVCNSAGDPFDPPYMMDDSRRTIMVSKNMSGHPSWLLNYQDTVNSDSFTVKGITYTAGQGKLQRVAIGEEQTRNGVPFVVVSFEIHLQKDGWILRPLDAGFRKKVGTTRENILNDGDDERVTAPVPLDGSGDVLLNPTSATAFYGSYTVYPTAVFSALPLT